MINPIFLNVEITFSEDKSPSIRFNTLASLPFLKNKVIGVEPSRLNLSRKEVLKDMEEAK